MGDDARTTDRILSDEPFYTIGQVATLLGVPAARQASGRETFPPAHG